MADLVEGEVKWFSDDKGYGFISQEDGDDVFFHYSALKGDGYKTIEDETPVEFELEESPKGPKAVAVFKLEDG